MVKSLFKILFIGFAWAMKLCGLALSKIGESIEKIITKRSSV
jgi:hypothetical protein